MPELPEVEAVCRKLRPHVCGRRIVEATVYRCAAPALATELAGKTIIAVNRRAKNILIELDDGRFLHTHLRMTGNLFAIPDHRFVTDRVRVSIALDDGSGIAFEDPRALGRMSLYSAGQVRELDAVTGPEPLGSGFTAEAFAHPARRSKLAAKQYLMDQRKVAGLGNIYAAEALFAARVDPRKPMEKLSLPKLKRLRGAIVDILYLAVQSAMAAYSGPGVFGEAEEFPLAVYGREGEPCYTCKRRIRRIPQGGRSTYYCPTCQR